MGLNIKVNDTYTVTSDQYQFIINKTQVAETGKKAGETVTTPVAYYSLNRLDLVQEYLILHTALSKKDITSFKELQEELANARQGVQETLFSVANLG